MSLSLDDLAIKHGQIAPETVDGGRYKWPHRVADLIHGWSLHNYHHQADLITMSDQDYLAALQAAETGGAPHEPAKAKAPDYKARAKALAEAQRAAAERPMADVPTREPEAEEAAEIDDLFASDSDESEKN